MDTELRHQNTDSLRGVVPNVARITALVTTIGAIACGRTDLDPNDYFIGQAEVGGAGVGSSGLASNGGSLGIGGRLTTTGTLITAAGGQLDQTGGSASTAFGLGGSAVSFPVAQPEHGLTDILPLLRPSSTCDTCVQEKCPAAVVCASDPACSLEVSCLVHGCWASARAQTNDPGLYGQIAMECAADLSTCGISVDVQACLGPTCQPTSIPATLIGLNIIPNCVYPYCTGYCQ